MTKLQQKRLRSFEYKALKRLGRFRPQDHISYARLYEMFDIRNTVVSAITHRRLIWLGHTLRMAPGRIPNQLLYYHERRPGWCRRPGQKRKSWKELVHGDTRHLTDIIRYQRGAATSWLASGTEWVRYLREVAENRLQWRRIVSDIVDCQD